MAGRAAIIVREITDDGLEGETPPTNLHRVMMG